MLTCFQFEDMNMFQHGQSVFEWFDDLYGYLTEPDAPLSKEWRLSDWIQDPKIKANLLPFNILQIYQIYHDCGKPFCRTIDEEGKQHFPNHAEASYLRWKECSDESEDSNLIANLIRMDMDCHTLKSEDIEEFAKRKEAASLLLTALCEIHSNAQMFGGIESTSFKIKWKKLDKLGKKMIQYLK